MERIGRYDPVNALRHVVKALLPAIMAVCLITAFTGPAAARTGDQVVRFVSPRHLSTVIGDTEIRLHVTPPAGKTVERVEIQVDGKVIDTLLGPPWTTVWDAGDASTDHSLHAIAHMSDGSREHAGVRTSKLRINIFADVDLVNLYVVVKDRSGAYVTDLSREEFNISEDGRPEQIDRFTTERRPLAIGIVLDTSLSMEGQQIEAARDSALRFLDALEPEDRGMIVSFNDRVRILRELTAEREELAEAIMSVEAKGGTALYDSIWKTVDKLRELKGRRVLVLLSDGKDEAANGLEPGSLHTLEEALDYALRAEVMIFAIGFGRNLHREMDFYGRFTQADILTRFGETTGGRVLFPKRAGALRQAFDAVALDLRHQYSIAYESNNKARDGAWREISLTTNNPDLEVVTRQGYFAPTDGNGKVSRAAGENR